MLWAQIGDERSNEIPSDGQTSVDFFSTFYWNGNILNPESSNSGKYIVHFVVGKANFPEGDDAQPPTSVEEMMQYVVPVDGILLENDYSSPEYMAINSEEGGLEILPVAKTRLKPVSRTDIDSITIISYTNFDRRGEIQRFSFDYKEYSFNNKAGDSNTFLNKVERYDILNNKWELLSPMNYCRVGPFSAYINGKIHVFGGYDGTRFLSEHEEYDLDKNLWKLSSPMIIDGMPYKSAFGMTFCYNGEIYLLGGLNQEYTSSSMIKYNPTTDSYTKFPKMPQGVALGTCNIIGNKVYVLFGASKISIGRDSDKISRFNYGIFTYDLSFGINGSWEIEKISSPLSETRILFYDINVGEISVSTTINPTAPYGIAVINEGQPNEEIVCFYSNKGKGNFKLLNPSKKYHFSGEQFKIINMAENRVGPNSVENGGFINVFDGITYYGYESTNSFTIRGTLGNYDPLNKTFSLTSISPNIPRARSSIQLINGISFLIGGSGSKSEWLDEVEKYNLSTMLFENMGKKGELIYPRHSMGTAYFGNYIYAIGGAGSGHEKGWLQIDVSSTPETVKADGLETSSISISALDSSGDPPENGTKFLLNGYISFPMNDNDRQEYKDKLKSIDTNSIVAENSSGEETQMQRISILPVLFSSRSINTSDGQAASILLERSEDPIKEVENLFNYLIEGDVPQDQEEFKKFSESQQKLLTSIEVGKSRDLYTIVVEAKCIDDFYFGSSDTDSSIYIDTYMGETLPDGSPTVKSKSSQLLYSNAQESLGISYFNLVRPAAKQHLSAKVRYYSDIASIPDVYFVTKNPVDPEEAKSLLDDIKNDVPFGSSPLYDALTAAAGERSSAPAQRNAIISVSDNEENLSATNPDYVIDSANSVTGKYKCPVFINNFVITDPISLAARRSRTDVSDLEKISSETGGNSFSIVNKSYIEFVINRIKSSAPSSLASGTIIGSYELAGPLFEISFVISGMVPGNKAEMELFVSNDDYNYENLGITIKYENSEITRYVFTSPILSKYIRFSLNMSTKTFESPRLKSISFIFIRPNVQYVFTYPHVSFGQVAELASIINHRLPEGCTVKIGLAHGNSFMFGRDYYNVNQPPIIERGVIMAINRSFDTYVGEISTRDRLYTDDFYVYKSKSGPWVGKSLLVLINNSNVSPESYILCPEKGIVIFNTKLKTNDIVEITDVMQPSEFRVGVEITNPTLQKGYLDDLAYCWTGTEDEVGGRLNRTPRAINLFISPIPAMPGGPISANYTFSDPDGDMEDKEKTEIMWYRNSLPIPELKNKKTIKNSDFTARISNQNDGIRKGQEWFFTVRVSDGKTYGPLNISQKIIIANNPPKVESARIISTGTDPLDFNTNSIIKVEMKIIDYDGDPESKHIYTWIVNGYQTKTGVDNAIKPDEKDNTGKKLLSANSIIKCEITPYDGTDYGDTFITDSITIKSTPPVVSNAEIIPSKPTMLSNLRVKYTYNDFDNLKDKSKIRWYRNGTLVSELNDVVQVSRILMISGQTWQAEIIPNNGMIDGKAVKTNTVEVSF